MKNLPKIITLPGDLVVWLDEFIEDKRKDVRHWGSLDINTAQQQVRSWSDFEMETYGYHQGQQAQDGKTHRRAIQRKTIDYNNCVMKYLIDRQTITNFDGRMQPNPNFVSQLYPAFATNLSSAITTKFVHLSMNKQRCPINVVRCGLD